MRVSVSELAPPLGLESEAGNGRIWGWSLGWAITAASVEATGGSDGWSQSPSWSAALGLALGAAGMFAGAWWSRVNRRGAAAWAGAFLLAAGLLALGVFGRNHAVLAFGASAGLVGLLGASVGNLLDRRPFSLVKGLVWGGAFMAAGFFGLIPSVYLSHFTGMLVEWLTGREAADGVGVVLGTALAGGIGGAIAAFLATTVGDADGLD